MSDADPSERLRVLLGIKVGVDVPEENNGIEALEELGDPVIIGVRLE
jgi:hypothetical protein